MDKICFVDRDGTLLVEPAETHQINGLEQMDYIPGVISSLKRLVENGWKVVMVTNQDRLGTPANPRDNYDAINAKLFQVLASEGVTFSEVFEDDSPADNPGPARKPATGMVDAYLRTNQIDFDKSFMVGDRETDIQFAENIGVRGFLLTNGGGVWTWPAIADEMISQPRRAKVSRKTKETAIEIELNLDGAGKTDIRTGVNFFDHMLDQIGKHGGFDLKVHCDGDLEIDEHHTIEDTGLALGEAFLKALGDKRGIERYAWERIVVMDEGKAEVSLDISGRPWLVFEAQFTREYVGDFPTEMLKHFFHSFADASRMTLNIKLEGENNHHIVEVAFKGLARTLRDAVRRTSTAIPSTKGTL